MDAAPVVPLVPVAPAPVAAVPAADSAPKVEASKADSKPVAGKGEPAKAEARPDALTKHKITVDGQDEEVDLDELRRRAQLSTAAEKRFREAAEAKKAAEAERAKLEKEMGEREGRIKTLMQAMKDNPREFAKEAAKHGLNPRQFAESVLTQFLEEDIAAEEAKALPPEQQKLKQLEKELEEYKRQEAARKADAEKSEAQKKADVEKAEQEKKKAEHEAAVAQKADEWGTQVRQALEQLPQAMRNEDTALELLTMLEETVERGLPVEPTHLAKRIEQRKIAEYNALLEKAADPDLTRLLSKGAQDRINKAIVSGFKGSDPLLNAKPLSAKSAAGEKAEEKPVRKYGSSLNARFARMGFGLANGKAAQGK